MKIIHEPPGEWHLGLWLNRMAFSVRLLKWAIIFFRRD